MCPILCTHNGIDLVHREQVRDIPRSQQIVDVDQESLVGYLAVSEQKHEAFILVPSLSIFQRERQYVDSVRL